MKDNSINSSCKTVYDYFKSAGDHRFIIPDYQRPYSWGEDQIKTLFDDLINYLDEGDYAKNDPYFLGSVVTYENAKTGEYEIIDGQQRITSMFLLLRVIYESIYQSDEPSFKKLIDLLEACLWKVDYEKGTVDKNQILIESKAVSDTKSSSFKNILITGRPSQDLSDRYSSNYMKFKEFFDDFTLKRRDKVQSFIAMILTKVIFLPIESSSEDFALRIFATLNDRGLPLSDADIFKAKIYGFLKTIEEKTLFVEEWQHLEDEAEENNESIQSLFYYYMFYLRAIKNDCSNTTPGVRKFYSTNDYEALKNKTVLPDLRILLNLWKVVNKREELKDENWSKNIGILRSLDILSSYTNDFWKYSVSVFYLKHHKEDSFEKEFLSFLRMLSVKLAEYYIELPTITHIKGEIMKLNIEILKASHPSFEMFRDIEIDQYNERIIGQNNKSFVRMLLKFVAYSNDAQDYLLPNYWEIEHIFPKTWDEHYYITEGCGFTKDYLDFVIENIGNKIPLEKKLNISASNNYFNEKKRVYEDSSIIDAVDLCKFADWKKENIEARNYESLNKIIRVFDKWKNEYNQNCSNSNNQSAETLLEGLLSDNKISQEDYLILLSKFTKN